MEEEQGSGAEWYGEWNQWSPDDWLNDDWSLEEQDWNGEWIGSVDDWSGDWSWNTQEWWNPTEAQPQSSNGAASSGSNELPENDPIDLDDSLIGFHMQAGLVDKSWILFDSGACAKTTGLTKRGLIGTLPLNESAPSLRSLSGKTLDVQGRKIVQPDCGNGHPLSVQFYVCTGIPFPLVSVARLLLQDFLQRAQPPESKRG
eukprot:s7597_g1.t1